MNQDSETPEEVSGDRYRLLIESITDYAIYMLDPDGLITSWNPGAERFKGYQAHEVIGTHFSRFYTEEDRTAGFPQRALARAAADDRFESEGWRVRKDGGKFWAHVVIDPIRSPSGDLLGFAKITRDLSERKEAQEALRSSREQMRLLVESVTDYAIYMLDRRGYVLNWNSGAQRIKGYRREEIVGQHFSRFYTPEDQANDVPALALETAEREGRFETESWHVRKDGSRFRAHVVLDPVCDDDGAIIGFAKVTRDMTVQMEQRKNLETAREALFQAQKMEAVGQLTGGVAHDFNNLLAAIIGSLELVRKRAPVDPRTSPLLDNAIKAAQRGAALTERMLTFARKQELKMGPVELPRLVGEMLDFLQRTIGANFEIKAQFPPNLPPVLSDRYQLEAAILNLAVNARDAMPNGGKIILKGRLEGSYGGDSDLAAGDYVVLSVVDTGFGMDPDTLLRAAEPFFTTKGVGKGTGLGLSMVHGLTAQSGGRVVLHSELDRGTTVEVWLPAAQDAAENSMGAALRKENGEQPALTVLAVDDDSLVLFITTAMLEDLGHMVITARSAPEALAVLDAHPDIDLVLTDEVMPGMTGSELALALRKTDPGLPVLVATGYAQQSPVAATVRAEYVRLSKPFTQVELAQAISELV